ncbi:hypothetical protein A1D17_03675 [Pseudomonas fluorescens]|uniref:Uncharacterized protein n=1 Tax=Pseudomonas fluorescens TaxID=294 RepID=A0A166QPN0_PSEFL|nr:hypothetical protein A1D17_03675 [Pseudomonas fluorescens]
MVSPFSEQLALATPTGLAPSLPIAIALRIANWVSVGAGRRYLINGRCYAVGFISTLGVPP